MAAPAEATHRGPLTGRQSGSGEADDRLLYNHDTGVLSYDAGSSGKAVAVQIAVIDTKAVLTVHDFVLI